MFEQRIRRLGLVLGGLLAVVLGRAFQLQVVEAEERVRKHEQTRSPFQTVVPRRGDILFADGTTMVSNESQYSVHFECRAFDAPRLRCRACGDRIAAKDRPETCRECGARSFDKLPPPDVGALAGILGISRETLDACLLEARTASKKSSLRSRRLLDAKVSREAASALALRADDFPGITVLAERVRIVEECVRRIVGRARTPYKEDVERLTDPEREGGAVLSGAEARLLLVGSSGLEAGYDDSLRGVPGRLIRLHARFGKPRPEPVLVRPVEDGRPVRTTIVKHVQEVAHTVVAGTGGVACAAVVLDLEDGAIVALDWKSDDGLNHAFARLLPGSVLKLATAVAALESGIDPAATLDCEKRGFLRKGVEYRCTGTHPGIDLPGAFAHSCNLYFMHRAEDVGGPALLDAYGRLGFFAEGPLGIARLQAGKVARTSHDELRWLGIGQGPVSVTPIHVAVAYARLATDGRTIVPYIDRDVGPDPASSEVDPVIRRHAPLLRGAARQVVVSGTATPVAALHTLEIAGKSGTAEVELTEKPRDAAGRRPRTHNAWFVGYAPSSAPRFVAVVVHEHVGGHGGDIAGPGVAQLLQAALR